MESRRGLHMSDHAWFKSFFGEDYFEIYRDAFPAEHTAAQVDGIVSLLGLDTGARVLDLACGHGRHAILLAKRGFDVTGYDLSEVFLERARADAEAEGVTADGFVATCANCPSTRTTSRPFAASGRPSGRVGASCWRPCTG